MSKCSLQLYLNENFTFSCSSLSTGGRNKSCLSQVINEKILENFNAETSDSRLDNFGRSLDCNSIFADYLVTHSESIQAYHEIRKQQEKIVRLCREKLTNRFPQQFVNCVKDDDIIRALKIIQDTELQLEEPHSSDKLIRCILNSIVSDEEKYFRDRDESSEKLINEIDYENLNINFPNTFIFSDDDSAPKKRKYGVVFRKLKTLFRKSRRLATITTLSLSSNFTDPLAQRKDIICRSDNLIRPIQQELRYPCRFTEAAGRATSIMNSSSWQDSSKEKDTKACVCHKQLQRLENEFIKQQTEIQLINKHLQQCLTMLQEMNDRPSKSNEFMKEVNFLNNDIIVAQETSYTSGPYGDRHHRRSHHPYTPTYGSSYLLKPLPHQQHEHRGSGHHLDPRHDPTRPHRESELRHHPSYIYNQRPSRISNGRSFVSDDHRSKKGNCCSRKRKKKKTQKINAKRKKKDKCFGCCGNTQNISSADTMSMISSNALVDEDTKRGSTCCSKKQSKSTAQFKCHQDCPGHRNVAASKSSSKKSKCCASKKSHHRCPEDCRRRGSNLAKSDSGMQTDYPYLSASSSSPGKLENSEHKKAHKTLGRDKTEAGKLDHKKEHHPEHKRDLHRPFGHHAPGSHLSGKSDHHPEHDSEHKADDSGEPPEKKIDPKLEEMLKQMLEDPNYTGSSSAVRHNNCKCKNCCQGKRPLRKKSRSKSKSVNTTSSTENIEKRKQKKKKKCSIFRLCKLICCRG